jgi:hypothetical protein
MQLDFTEVSTPKLIDLLSRQNGLRLHDLMSLQGEKINPNGETVQITLTAIFPEKEEFEISIPEKGQRRPGPLSLAILSDAGWFPSPRLSELIRHLESAADKADPFNLATLQARIEKEREAATRHRESASHNRLCDAALRAALDALSVPEGKVRDWYLVLMAMSKRRDHLSIRSAKEAQFLDDQILAAREYGPALRSTPKQWTWQNDILRRSVDTLQTHLAT